SKYWTATAQQRPPRMPANAADTGQTATRLADGRWLLLGSEGAESAASLWNPQTGSADPSGGGTHVPRAWHSATLLPDGTVLIAGGRGPTGEIVQIAELFDPNASAFMPITMDGGTPRAGHSATLLTDGRVLIAGGRAAVIAPAARSKSGMCRRGASPCCPHRSIARARRTRRRSSRTAACCSRMAWMPTASA